MPSLRFRRVEQIRQGHVVTSSSITSSSLPGKDDLRTSGSSVSSESVIAFRDRGEDGSLRPGSVVARDAPTRRCSVVVDAAEAVARAPSTSSACRGLESFTPQWKATVNARSRYHKPLGERYEDGSLYLKTNLARRQASLPSAPAFFRRSRSHV